MNEQSIKQLINSILQDDPKLKDRLNETQILNAWQQIVGDNVMQQIEKIFVRDNILFVQVTTSILRQELYFKKTKICSQINTLLKRKQLLDIVLK